MSLRRMALVAAVLLAMPRSIGAADDLAGSALRVAGIGSGLVVHLGTTDGQLEVALSGDGQRLVHGLAADDKLIARAREAIVRSGAYGRVSVDAWNDHRRLPYADNVVNLLVADLDALAGAGSRTNPSGNSAEAGLSIDEIMRVLAPGGVAYLNRGGTWAATVKSQPAGIDDWTHINHGPDGNRVSRDQVAGPPQHIRWIAGPTWPTEANGPQAALSAGGRLFYMFDQASSRRPTQPSPTLIARDAHNGLLLWQRRLAVGGFVPLAFIAAKDRVYASIDTRGPLVALDARSGEILQTYAEAGEPEWAVLADGKLLMCAGARYGKTLMCLDALSGKRLWHVDGLRIEPSGAVPNVVVAGGNVYWLQWRERKLGCISLASGMSAWDGE
jgi:hypothetical protein